MNYGMRCHDLCPKTDIDTLVNTIAANHVDQIQLAMGKSIAGYNFDHGHYSPGFARMIRKKLDENDIHVAVLGCYINPVNPDEKERQKAVAKFIEHLKYAKLANGITDTPALMAAKAHLRNERPLLVSISTNDALGMNMKNIGLLLNTKHVYFVPFKQDNPQKKPNSMIASLEYLIPAAEAALEGRQYQPIIQ